jgi:hypothetical protein
VRPQVQILVLPQKKKERKKRRKRRGREGRRKKAKEKKKKHRIGFIVNNSYLKRIERRPERPLVTLPMTF